MKNIFYLIPFLVYCTAYINENSEKWCYYGRKFTWKGYINKYLCCNGYYLLDSDCSFSFDEDCSAEGKTCMPYCFPKCGQNSYCASPNNCKCNMGYIENDYGKCVPQCSSSCMLHGYCEEPNVCTCHKGYSFNNLKNTCEPICANGCPDLSACIQPNVCECEEGYVFRNISGIVPHCEPICKQDCSNYGKCTAPNVCECFDGYEKDIHNETSVLCKAKCDNCINGFCFAPDTCVCNAGYLMGPNKTCQAICSLHCINSKCVSPEICECLPGYQLKEFSVNECIPILFSTYTTEYTEDTSTSTITESLDTTTTAYVTDLVSCQQNCNCWQRNDTLDNNCLPICNDTDIDIEFCLNTTECRYENNKNAYFCFIQQDLLEVQYICLNQTECQYDLLEDYEKSNMWLILFIILLILFTIFSVYAIYIFSKKFMSNKKSVDLNVEYCKVSSKN